ncbi:DUF2333 family protein [Natronobiforma cellulositropha]|uniref:DUF2333 family protein n=1 Tax=Natronobiforma cellulositropha TaxID=1679076 RepID=UPI0021D5F5DA|nr:DUF2333 family protein [Natronobiforma cellulositropha]
MHPREFPADRRTNVRDQLERVERRLGQLEQTLAAVASENGRVRVAGPCTRCERSLLLARGDTLYCPCCEYRRSL